MNLDGLARVIAVVAGSAGCLDAPFQITLPDVRANSLLLAAGPRNGAGTILIEPFGGAEKRPFALEASDDLTFEVGFYDRALDDLGLSAGRAREIPSDQPQHPLPLGGRFFTATRTATAISSWVEVEDPPPFLAALRISNRCPHVSSDSAYFGPVVSRQNTGSPGVEGVAALDERRVIVTIADGEVRVVTRGEGERSMGRLPVLDPAERPQVVRVGDGRVMLLGGYNAARSAALVRILDEGTDTSTLPPPVAETFRGIVRIAGSRPGYPAEAFAYSKSSGYRFLDRGVETIDVVGATSVAWIAPGVGVFGKAQSFTIYRQGQLETHSTLASAEAFRIYAVGGTERLGLFLAEETMRLDGPNEQRLVHFDLETGRIRLSAGGSILGGTPKLWMPLGRAVIIGGDASLVMYDDALCSPLMAEPYRFEFGSEIDEHRAVISGSLTFGHSGYHDVVSWLEL